MAHKQQCFTGPSALTHSKPCFARPPPPKSQIPRPVKGKPCLARPSVLAGPPLPHHLGKLPSQIPCPPDVNKEITVFPSEEDLHMSTLVPLPSVCATKETPMPAEPCSALTTPQYNRWGVGSRAQTLQTARPVLPHAHFSPGCLSLTMRQPSDNYKGDHRLSPATTCPYPSQW